jgi:D-sedoheptulose 7-phosphate isomerase
MSTNGAFSEKYIIESITILSTIDREEIEKLAHGLLRIKDNNGRLFILGVGGSAGTASHAVNDFRKICQIETYTPVDNVPELTARINDEGWDSCFSEWLKGSKLNEFDGILILSVGGGSSEKNVSMNLVKAIDYAITKGSSIFGIVGRDGGYTKQKSGACVVIPTLEVDRITPHSEGLCSVILHLLVSHPILKVTQTKWESTR